MKILYISSVCSPKILDTIFNTSLIKPGQAVQKFHRLLLEGLSKNFDTCQVTVLSSIPVSPSGHKKKYWNLPNDFWKGIQFQYIPIINLPIIKHFFVFIVTFFKVIFWHFSNFKKEKIIVCDILNVSIVWATFFASKLIGQPIAVIVTDLPIFMLSSTTKISFAKKSYLKIASFILHRFDYYIGLTKQMNDVVNPYNKPFMVMEGLVDSDISFEQDPLSVKNGKRIFLYAGGIYEKYGVKNLIEAFMLLPQNDIELHIYGSGDLEIEMVKYCKLDPRILYFGVVNNSTVVKRLEEALVLINPRPTTEEFTKFSFPSKNMEYMVSGTPLLTTKLPGMPVEYNEYVYLFEDESITGISKTLNFLLSKKDEELRSFGNKAKQFVLSKKSNVMQAKKIIDFLKINK
jgi:glycosyltransferase involved in cell wall biosynthesis